MNNTYFVNFKYPHFIREFYSTKYYQQVWLQRYHPIKCEMEIRRNVQHYNPGNPRKSVHCPQQSNNNLDIYCYQI